MTVLPRTPFKVQKPTLATCSLTGCFGCHMSLLDIDERILELADLAYAACLSATSTVEAPWYVVPADDKDDARLIVSQIVLDTFEHLKMSYPKVTAEREKDLKSIRDQLSK